jgi:glyoxylase-like metal-dependent hydrolase (beta-lactamase superfamily II)
MTLDGTNTWILGSADGGPVVVVDPGPDEPDHLEAVVRAAHGPVALILLTHGHIDHTEGAASLASATGAPVRAWDPGLAMGGEGFTDGEVLDFGDWRIDVVATPGHSSDSVCLVLPHDGTLLTGDTVLGRGTAVVAWPDGDLAAYLDSLARLRDLVSPGPIRRLAPGHGPVLDDPLAIVDAYDAHRRARLAEVTEVVSSGVTEPGEVVAIVYRDVPEVLWPAAEMSVRAQLAYLAR